MLQLTHSSLAIEGVPSENSILINELLTVYLNSVFSFSPKNVRLYWDDIKKTVVEAPTLNVIGATKQEMKHKFVQKNISEIKTKEGETLTINYLANIIKDNFSSYIKDIESTKDKIISIKRLIDKKGTITLLATLDEYLAKEISKRSNVKKSKIGMCSVCRKNQAQSLFSSLTHPFEDGTRLFTDLFSKEGEPICDICILIYQLGSRKKRFYSEESKDNKFFFYFNSPSLINLFEIKNELHINDDKVLLRDEKKDTTKTISNNFHFFSYKRHGNNYNFFTYNNKDRLLKLIIGCFIEINHKEEVWQDIEEESLFDGSSINTFSETPSGKGTLSEYTQLSRFFHFLNILTKTSTKFDKNYNLFNMMFSRDYSKGDIINILSQGSITNPKDEDRHYFQEFVSAFLDFQPLHSYYYHFQFNLFKNMDKQRVLPDSLREFEDAYIAYTKGKDSPDLLIHELCYRVGREMGRFLGFLGDKHKDLIFVLRAVNNQPQLIAFLRDFEFKYLKEKETTQKGETFSFSTKAEKNIDFFNSFDTLLEIIAHLKNITMVRDYLSIYIISAFSKQQYHIKKDSDN